MRFQFQWPIGPALACALAVLFGLSAPAAEASVSYTFTTTSGTASGQAYTTVGGASVALTAWSNGGTGGKMAPGSLTFWDSSGIGVNNGFGSSTDANEGNPPEHAVDNDGLTDAVLLDFGAGNLFSMNSFSIGWWSGDSDLVVLAYTGSGTPSLTSTTLGGLTGAGWSGKKYANVVTDTAVNTTLSFNSRYWLVLAYNSTFASLASGLGSAFGEGNDAFKFKSVAGDVTRTVPLPATTALLGLGALALRRRRTGSEPA